MLHIRNIWVGASDGTIADITNTSPYLHWEQRTSPAADRAGQESANPVTLRD